LNVDNVENVRKMIELNKKMKNWHEKKWKLKSKMKGCHVLIILLFKTVCPQIQGCLVRGVGLGVWG
jgi:hypothetical protein